MPTDTGFQVNPSSASSAVKFHTDQVTIDGLLALLERVKISWGAPGAAVDVSAANPFPVADSAAEASLVSILAKLSADPASQTTLAAVLAKLTSDPATQTTLAAVLAKLPASPALDASLQSILTKLSSDPATQTTLAAILTKLNGTITTSAQAAGDLAGTLTDGRKTVTTPGTAVALTTTSVCKWVAVTALLTNTAQVNVGGSSVLATVGGATGTALSAGDSVTIPVNDPSKVFVDARVAAEGVSFTVGS